MDFHQKFEPKGKRVLHGAGQQFPEDFSDYWKAVSPYHPILYMTYIEIKYPDQKWFRRIKSEIRSFGRVQLQIGLSMTNELQGKNIHYENEIAEGKYDNAIDRFCKGVKELKKPTFVRLGYEFNGDWNGYTPKQFIAAWRHVVDCVRKNKVNNIAFVWCYSPDGKTNYMDFYPGDDYVDWWGIDLFSPKHIVKNRVTEKFLHDAKQHRKPVMIGESSCRKVDVHHGKRCWDVWFKPFFSWMNTHPEIKAFCYINWNWSKFPHWKDWGDCRISQNEYVLKKYRQELQKKKFVHDKK